MTTGVTIQALALCVQLIALIYQVDIFLKSKKQRRKFQDILLEHNTLHGKMTKAFTDNDMTLYREIKTEIRELLGETRKEAQESIK